MKFNVIQKLKSLDLFVVIVTVLYAVLTLLCVINHEVTEDEVQVWQLCKYLNIPELVNHLHNEGHPIFFYLLVMPFAKLSSDIIFMQLVCWLACCSAVFILLKYSPFKIYTNLAIITSAGFTYFLPIIARSYSVIPILVFLSVILYLKQKQHPLLYGIILLLIANTHAIMWGFVTILFVFFIKDLINENLYKENKSYIISALIIFTGLCFVIFQLHDTSNSNAFITLQQFDSIQNNAQWVITNFFVNACNYIDPSDNKKRVLFSFEILACCLMLLNFAIIFINMFIKNKRLFLIAVGAVSFQLFIYIFMYPGFVYVSRIFCAFIIILFCCWILITQNKQAEKPINIALTIIFLLTSYNGFHYYIEDIKEKIK